MSRLRFLAKIIVKIPFIVNFFRALWIQITLYSNSFNIIKFQDIIVRESKKLELTNEKDSNYIKLLEVLYLLRPKKIKEDEMIRIGPKGEGGYVLYNNVEKITKLISIGVAKDTSFEEDFSQKSLGKIFIELYDHTDRPVRNLPSNFIFHSIGISNSDFEDPKLLSLGTIIKNSLKISDISILKIDIDGAEYLALTEIDPDIYKRFDQIIIEIHDICEKNISNGKLQSIVNNISRNFDVIHLHPNSIEPWINVYGVCLPKVLEITFLNRIYSDIYIKEIPIFPTTLDYPNQLNNEMILGAFIYPEPGKSINNSNSF